jgi:hypothetical protein
MKLAGWKKDPLHSEGQETGVIAPAAENVGTYSDLQRKRWHLLWQY